MFHQKFIPFHDEWYESLSAYKPKNELLKIIHAILPTKWYSNRGNGIWYYLNPQDNDLPIQGWKIHISAIPSNCEEILKETARVCFDKNAPFKFLLDKTLLNFMIRKIQSRGSSGKFITIYPRNENHFFEILDALYPVLKDFKGPFILSDRRYKDAKTIYYRYGGIKGVTALNIKGEQDYILSSPEGTHFQDIRHPYWNPPNWITDPFEQSSEEENEEFLLNDRYLIESALSFTVTGGVYLARDTLNNQKVILKEARPHTAVDINGYDAVQRLDREYRILKNLENTGVTPKPIEKFDEWEHLFVVEEYIDGPHLGKYTINSNPLMRINPDKSMKNSYINKTKNIWVNLANAINKIHQEGIIIGDISLKNILISNMDTGSIRIIDLEGSWELGKEPTGQIVTPGYSSGNSQELFPMENDVYSFGAIMLGTLFPINNLLTSKGFVLNNFLSELVMDLNLGNSILDIIKGCLDKEPRERPHLTTVVNQLKTNNNISINDSSLKKFPTHDFINQNLESKLKDITRYIKNTMDTSRNDRLFPSDPIQYYTNPLSVAYGASGIIYALKKIEGEVPQEAIAWMLLQDVASDKFTPGLYVGSSGIAWTYWEIGLQEVAINILKKSSKHPLLWDSPDLFYGAAGYGLTSLKMFLETRDNFWLDQAIDIGNRLLSQAKQSNRGCFWHDKSGKTYLGYSRGASGIALFLLYLSLVTGDDKYINVGRQAISFDLSFIKRTEQDHYSTPRGTIDELENVLSPYWFDGSSGIATSLIRYWAVTKDAEYKRILDNLLPDLYRKYTIFPGVFKGLAGLGNTLLDAHQFIGENDYFEQSIKTATGIELFGINNQKGLAYPGDQLFRMSNDFGTGSAGIALFLNRLLDIDKSKENFNFTLDKIIKNELFKEEKY